MRGVFFGQVHTDAGQRTFQSLSGTVPRDSGDGKFENAILTDCLALALEPDRVDSAAGHLTLASVIFHPDTAAAAAEDTHSEAAPPRPSDTVCVVLGHNEGFTVASLQRIAHLVCDVMRVLGATVVTDLGGQSTTFPAESIDHAERAVRYIRRHMHQPEILLQGRTALHPHRVRFLGTSVTAAIDEAGGTLQADLAGAAVYYGPDALSLYANDRAAAVVPQDRTAIDLVAVACFSEQDSADEGPLELQAREAEGLLLGAALTRETVRLRAVRQVAHDIASFADCLSAAASGRKGTLDHEGGGQDDSEGNGSGEEDSLLGMVAQREAAFVDTVAQLRQQPPPHAHPAFHPDPSSPSLAEGWTATVGVFARTAADPRLPMALHLHWQPMDSTARDAATRAMPAGMEAEDQAVLLAAREEDNRLAPHGFGTVGLTTGGEATASSAGGRSFCEGLAAGISGFGPEVDVMLRNHVLEQRGEPVAGLFEAAPQCICFAAVDRTLRHSAPLSANMVATGSVTAPGRETLRDRAAAAGAYQSLDWLDDCFRRHVCRAQRTVLSDFTEAVWAGRGGVFHYVVCRLEKDKDRWRYLGAVDDVLGLKIRPQQRAPPEVAPKGQPDTVIELHALYIPGTTLPQVEACVARMAELLAEFYNSAALDYS